MTKNEALYKYLKMDYRLPLSVRQNYSVLSYNSVGWAFYWDGYKYNIKPMRGRLYYAGINITERTILKLVKLL